jgi:hypothetical protein
MFDPNRLSTTLTQSVLAARSALVPLTPRTEEVYCEHRTESCCGDRRVAWIDADLVKAYPDNNLLHNRAGALDGFRELYIGRDLFQSVVIVRV